MAYDVTSNFISQSRSKTPTVYREFTIAGSDYSERLMKWPSFSRAWDDIRPKSLQLKLANGDQGMNFLRNDKTLMEGECKIKIGFGEGGVSGHWELDSGAYDNKSLDVSSQDVNPAGLFMKGDGTRVFVAGPTGDAIYQYSLSTEYDISTASYDSKSLDISVESSAVAGMFVGDNGTKVYVIEPNYVYQYTLSTAWDISTGSYDSKSFDVYSQDAIPQCVFLSSDGTKMYMVGIVHSTIFQYTLSTAWDISTASYASKSLDLSSQNTLMAGITFNTDGTKVYAVSNGGDRVYQYTLSTAWDISTGTYDNKTLNVVNEDIIPTGISFEDNGKYLYVAGDSNAAIFQYKLETDETIDLFTGKIKGIKYVGETCTIAMTDKFQQLSERQVGTSDVPVSYTGSNYLPSDIAWWIVTSYGGYSTVTSTSNPDIDYEAFNDWAAIFSGDSVLVQAEFDGQKCTEILRKMARQTHSAIFIKENKISFHRFGIADANVASLGPSEIIDLALSFDTDDIINRQYVAGDYDVDSNYHQFTVVDVNTASVNSFGAKENYLKDTNLWYVDSGSALNLAQRMILTTADPDDSINIKTGLIGIDRQVGETIFVSDAFHGITENYRILKHKIDTDRGIVEFDIDRTQVTGTFILDTTSLGSTTEVLT